MTKSREIERNRRERYWLEHPLGFDCQVEVRTPTTKTAFLGAGAGHPLWYGVPIEFNAWTKERARFQVREDGFYLMGDKSTWYIPFEDVVRVRWYSLGGAMLNIRTGGVVYIHGPVRAPVCGALYLTGQLDPVNLVQFLEEGG